MVKTKSLKRFAMAPPVKPIPAETMYLSRKNVSDDIISSIIDHTIDWCIDTFGMNPNREHPYISWEWNTLDSDDNDKQSIARYDSDTNTISLKVRGHRTAKVFIKTIIHEYIHYLQPTKGGWYERWNKEYGYYKNPYEIEAYYLSDMYAQTATNSVMEKL
jgi:hypothetical protein